MTSLGLWSCLDKNPTAPLDEAAVRMLDITPLPRPTPTPGPYAYAPFWFQDWVVREQRCSPDPTYRAGGTVSVDTAWAAMRSLYASMRYGDSPEPYPTSCEARTYSQGVCIHQALAGYGILRNDYGVGDDNVFITIYVWSDGGMHAIVTLRTEGDLWLFDRDYGPEYPHMPMRERDYVRLWADVRVAGRFNMQWYDGPAQAVLNFFKLQAHDLP